MNVREIAQVTGKAERSVRRWIGKMADKSSVVADKATASTSTYPADYDLEETCSIIEIGLGKNAADLYRMSARPRSNDQGSERLDRIELAVESLVKMIPSIVRETVQAVQRPQLEYVQDYYSILGYANHKKITLTFSDIQRLGREAAQRSRLENREIRRVPDERFGDVGSYHVSILEKVFDVGERA